MWEVDEDKPSTWVKFRPSLCEGCAAGCCRLPVEVTAADLLRMGLVSEDEAADGMKRAAKRLVADGVLKSYRARTGLGTLEQTEKGDCRYLDRERRCVLYDKRPDVCRRFPEIGPRPGYCPAKMKNATVGRPSASHHGVFRDLSR